MSSLCREKMMKHLHADPTKNDCPKCTNCPIAYNHKDLRRGTLLGEQMSHRENVPQKNMHGNISGTVEHF